MNGSNCYFINLKEQPAREDGGQEQNQLEPDLYLYLLTGSSSNAHGKDYAGYEASLAGEHNCILSSLSHKRAEVRKQPMRRGLEHSYFPRTHG